MTTITRDPARPPGRAYGYCRVSTDQQRESGLGLEAQRCAIEQTAARLQLPLVHTFTDAGLSGALSIEARPALADALNALRRNDVLIVAKRDRIARDVLQAVVIERAALKRGARIVSAAGEGTEADADDPTAALMRRMMDAFNEYERLVIGMRTRAALRAKRARGQRAGTEPYGYRANEDGKTLAPHREEQRILAVIHECREARYSLRDIAGELNTRGFTTRTGTPFRFEYVRSIVRTVDRHAAPVAR